MQLQACGMVWRAVTLLFQVVHRVGFLNVCYELLSIANALLHSRAIGRLHSLSAMGSTHCCAATAVTLSQTYLQVVVDVVHDMMSHSMGLQGCCWYTW